MEWIHGVKRRAADTRATDWPTDFWDSASYWSQCSWSMNEWTHAPVLWEYWTAIVHDASIMASRAHRTPPLISETMSNYFSNKCVNNNNNNNNGYSKYETQSFTPALRFRLNLLRCTMHMHALRFPCTNMKCRPPPRLQNYCPVENKNSFLHDTACRTLRIYM